MCVAFTILQVVLSNVQSLSSDSLSATDATPE